jgi:hypothetical protein
MSKRDKLAMRKRVHFIQFMKRVFRVGKANDGLFARKAKSSAAAVAQARSHIASNPRGMQDL